MTTLKYFLKSIPVILFLLLITPGAKAQDRGAGHKIVFQLTDSSHAGQKSLTNQLKNLSNGWPEAQFEVVVHSAGISYLLKAQSAFSAEIIALSERGVKFKACENTLAAKEIEKSELLPVAGFVPMGIGELVLKQEAGWSYIKAGH